MPDDHAGFVAYLPDMPTVDYADVSGYHDSLTNGASELIAGVKLAGRSETVPEPPDNRGESPAVTLLIVRPVTCGCVVPTPI